MDDGIAEIVFGQKCTILHVQSQKFFVDDIPRGPDSHRSAPPQCLDPDTNFRLAGQRSHCSCFTKRPLDQTRLRFSVDCMSRLYLWIRHDRSMKRVWLRHFGPRKHFLLECAAFNNIRWNAYCSGHIAQAYMTYLYGINALQYVLISSDLVITGA